MPDQLTAWQQELWPVAPDWRALVDDFLVSPIGEQLKQQLVARLRENAVIYPPNPFRALELTPLSSLRVLILGQDPYHGPGQAEGLAFSVPDGVKMPPSLRNINKELERERLQGEICTSSRRPTSLVSWASQGVLLLNTCLTVEQSRPASHSKLGWEALTSGIIKTIQTSSSPVVWMLWGAHAQKMVSDVASHHLLLTANHPSPLSALRPPSPFIGCGHFSQANRFLQEKGLAPIDW